jgi:hypothetical protein
MRRVLKTERGSQLCKQRAQLIEPIFGHTKRPGQLTGTRVARSAGRPDTLST